MAKLYFMDREFEGISFELDQSLECQDIRLLFGDEWYWLHYRFFNCRDRILSEKSSALRTHLYNLAAALYRASETLVSGEGVESGYSEDEIEAFVSELTKIAEHSKAFPISLWIFGDETTKSFLDSELARLPTSDHIRALIELPHFQRLEGERLAYGHDAEKPALKRFRNEEAAYNKRRKDRQRGRR